MTPPAPLPFRTVTEAVLGAARRSPDKAALRFFRGGAWRETTYREFADRVERIAGGLVSLGVAKGDRVAIVSESGPEWALADIGGLAAGATVVGVYPQLPPADSAAILGHCGAKVVFVSPSVASKVASLKDSLPERPTLVWLVGEGPAGNGLTLAALEERSAAGGADVAARTVREGRGEDALAIVYTSGTTGEPKGVIQTHGAAIFTISAIVETVGEERASRLDLNLSFLPLAHSLERMGGHYFPLCTGRTIAYARSLETLGEDFAAVRPRFALVVPRLLEKVHAKVLTAVASSSAPARALFRAALATGTERSRLLEAHEAIPPLLALRYALFDRLVFRKIRARLGGRIEILVCGGAPLSAEVARFFHASGILVCEGWGLTETSAPATLNTPGAFRFGTVGRPLPGVTLDIAGDGELLVKGGNVFPGYFHDETATREAFTPEGYFRTGDIGAVDEDGFCRIVDRKKELIVTAGGKNVPPQKVELLLKRRPPIANALLVGDRRPCCVALLAVDREALAAIRPDLASAQLSSGPVRAVIEKEVYAVNATLPRHEQVHDFRVVPEDFSVENGELTFTLKPKRRVLERRYGDLIEEMYSGHGKGGG